MNKTISKEIKNKLESVSHQVIETNLQHKILRMEEAVTFAREREDEVIWEVTNGYEEGYASVVDEIVKKIKPDYIVVPVGSGGIFVGMIHSLQKYQLPTKVIGIGVQNTLSSYADKLYTPWSPYTKAILNLQKNGHFLYRLTENEVKETYKKFKNIIVCEPSSVVVFAVFKKHQFNPKDKIVLLNSGKSFFSS